MTSVSPLYNPFTRRTFWGRKKELNIITDRLLGASPQSIVIIGEPYMGKTRLVKHLKEQPLIDEQAVEHHYMFVYLDCRRYIDLIEDWQPAAAPKREQAVEQPDERDMGNFAAARFWWDLYHALPLSRQGNEPFHEPMRTDTDTVLLDTIYDISFAIEKWVRNYHQPVIFILDNFEGVAHLPVRTSDRLRSLGDNCAFILTSRYALYVLYSYDPASWAEPSPFYNIFSDPIYLGLLAEQEVNEYLEEAAQTAKERGSCWSEQDVFFISQMAGRHPELLRIACARLFEDRLSPQLSSEPEANQRDDTFLALRIMQDARQVCNRLWSGLANPELYGLVRFPGLDGEETSSKLSPYQSTLLEIARGRPLPDWATSNAAILFELEQRGLIERVKGTWRIFSEAMKRFVLSQVQLPNTGDTEMLAVSATPPPSTRAVKEDDKPFTYMEGKVYEYLKSRLNEVCDRTEIMQGVWEEDALPSNSALQKIIERIRDKIESDPDSPYKLISVRGRGYMLRRVM